MYHKVNSLRYGFELGCIDIIALCETWLRPEVPDSLVNIDNFNRIRNDREGRRGGVTCLYINKRLSYRPYESNTRNIEIQAVVVDRLGDNVKHKPMIVVLVYWLPNSIDRIALEEIKDFIDRLDNIDKNELFCYGDLNWNYHDTKSLG